MRARSSSSCGPVCGSRRDGLEVEQGRGDEQELGGLAQVPVGVGGLGRLDVGDELVGDLGQGDLGDVELVLADQAEQQVERPGEVVEVHLERRRRPARDDPTGGQLTRPGAGRQLDLRDSGDLATASVEGSVVGVDRGAADGVLPVIESRGQAAPPRAISSRASCR